MRSGSSPFQFSNSSAPAHAVSLGSPAHAGHVVGARVRGQNIPRVLPFGRGFFLKTFNVQILIVLLLGAGWAPAADLAGNKNQNPAAASLPLPAVGADNLGSHHWSFQPLSEPSLPAV